MVQCVQTLKVLYGFLNRGLICAALNTNKKNYKMTPLHKINGERAATFCLCCNSIIELGMTNSIFCKKCMYLPIKEVVGNFVLASLSGHFDVAVQDCNCFCTARTQEAIQFAKLFKTYTLNLEQDNYRGSREKLGEIEFKEVSIPVLDSHESILTVVNAYTQFGFNVSLAHNPKPVLSYEALVKALQKINDEFAGLHIVMPQIGCGLSGGKWIVLKHLIKKHLKDCKVTVIRSSAISVQEQQEFDDLPF